MDLDIKWCKNLYRKQEIIIIKKKKNLFMQLEKLIKILIKFIHQYITII